MNAMPIAGPMPQTPEWLALRLYDPDRDGHKVVFGASEAAAVLGLSPYATPLDVYLQKTGQLPAKEDTEAMLIGRFLEGPVLDLYSHKTSRELRRNLPFYFHPKHDFMGATPDAMADGEEPRAVDAKTTTHRRYNAHADVVDDMFGEEGTDQMPADYVIQAQQQAAVMGVDKVDFPVLFDGRTLRIYTVHRDDVLIKALVDAEKELAERIINCDPPEPNWQHPQAKTCLQALNGLERDLSIVLSDEGFERWLNRTRRKEQIKELEALNAEDEVRILAEMQSAEFALFPTGEKEIRRCVIAPTHYTEKDVEDVRSKVGQVKRNGYEYFRERKTSS